ncbi:S1/P1 nuclease [Legionella saoudiensis]|uniref:S1/P1 nuclease n=1 Tax=Legionella saoudiensis TaxID=1750561 RepID=UPI00072FE4B2|nr:S1/P1 nuclease [Legionella saoudiensis]
MKRISYLLILGLMALNSYGWNMQGHQVVAQVAYDNLTPQAKEMCRRILNSRSKKSSNANFIAAAIWLDQIRFKNVHWYDTFHYINTPFAEDDTTLPSVERSNAIWGIKNAIAALSAKKSSAADKRLSLLILIHLVGDIHQPLHTATKVSHRLPKGDLGGNLFPLGNNRVGSNLHQYWDNGAGFFIGRRKIGQIKFKARLLEQRWPCNQISTLNNPGQWAKASHELATSQAYHIYPKEIPSKQYQQRAQSLIQKQTATAGCRLASVLNELAKKP